MNTRKHIKNKIDEVSDDEKFAQGIMQAVKMLYKLNLDYAVLGSCGIQSYFDYFLRLPNDLDIIINYDNINKIEDYCEQHNHKFNEQLGRTKIFINELPIHIIPDKMNSIDKATNKIFTQVDLSNFINSSKKRKIRLLNSSLTPKIHVFPLEVNLLIELIRPIYTGSLMNIYFIMRYINIDYKFFQTLFSQNKDLNEIIISRLNDYPDKIKKMTYFNKSDIEKAIKKINKLKKGLTSD